MRIPKLLLAALVALVILAAGVDTLAGKGGGGKKPPPDEPPADPAVAVIDNGSGHLVVMNEDGSNVTVLLTEDEAGGYIGPPDWSPDGTQLVFTVYYPTDNSAGPSSRIHVVGVDGSGFTELRARNNYLLGWSKSNPAEQGASHAWSPCALPDGLERIAYNDREVRDDGSRGNHHVFLMETDGSNPIDTGKATGCLSWSPDATRLAVDRGTNGIRVHSFGVDGSDTLTITASPRYDLGVEVLHVAWSKTQDDILAVTVRTSSGGEVWRVDLRDAVANGYNTDGTELFSLTARTVLASTLGGPTQDLSECDWSPDDTKLALDRYGNPTHGGKPGRGRSTWGCWVLDLTSGAEPLLLYRGGYYPAWRR